jgi:NAD(P)-dependent dehydrogenase (short-subunit alcohol dehydrogenase family)
MSSPLDFTGRVVLITGGSRGIGRGIAEAFLASGADVAVCGRKAPDELPSAGGKSAIFVGADVRDAEQVEKMVDEVIERLGRLDVLVNNAGGAPFAEAATVSPRFSEKIVQLNLTAALHCAQQANRVMQGQDTGGSMAPPRQG